MWHMIPSPARYRLKYCLKGPLNPKQPTNHDPVSTILQIVQPFSNENIYTQPNTS